MRKPPYSVPSMPEIESIPWNGLNVVSTFSGTGGSCLGYRMAGFRVLWANEFIENARECYRLNHPAATIDNRDIRTVEVDDILAAVGMKSGEVDLFDGSPPCDSFSTAGKREKGWGKEKSYMSGERHQRTDDLTWEWIRILDGLQPRSFVMENVSGLVKGKAKGIFKMMLKDIKACGYRVSCRVLDAKWLGVPQSRQRTIFVGVREDIDAEPCHPPPLPYFYSVRDVFPEAVTVPYLTTGKQPIRQTADKPCPTVTSFNIGGAGDKVDVRRFVHDTKGQPQFSVGDFTDKPCPAILTTAHHYQVHETETERRKFTIAELKRICGFPDDFRLVGKYSEQWARLGMCVPPVMMAAIAATVRDRILLPEATDGN